MNNYDRLLIAFGITCATALLLSTISAEAGAGFGLITMFFLGFLAICEGTD